jgi:ASC-1-like (ASCH) protein
MNTHIAIMKKSWHLTEKILSKEKKIESRWYQNKVKPWNALHVGEEIYFKNTGEPVTLKATVVKVLQFENLTAQKVKDLLLQYGKEDGLGETWQDYKPYYERFKNKNYCILVFLKNSQKITDPFEIDKTGFGAMAAWITTKDIQKRKK